MSIVVAIIFCVHIEYLNRSLIAQVANDEVSQPLQQDHHPPSQDRPSKLVINQDPNEDQSLRD